MAAVLLFAALAAGCAIVEPSDDARVRWGRSIDGLQMGIDTAEVANILGRPDEVVMGDFPGVVYEYTSGRHARLSAAIWTETGEGLKSVRVESPYEGTTDEGIGIGSARTRVHQLLGEPDFTTDNTAGGWRVDAYYFERTQFSLRYADGIVESISMTAR